MEKRKATATLFAARVMRPVSLAAATLALVVATTTFILQRSGDLLVSSVPSGAEVYINERLHGKTPIHVELKEGVYRVKAILQGFEPIDILTSVVRNKKNSLDIRLSPTTPLSTWDLDQIAEKIEVINRQIRAMETRTNKLTTPNVEQVKRLSSEIENMRSDLKSLQEMIMESPEKTIALPLIKKDIQQLKEETRALKNEIDRVFGLSKWFLGTLIAMSVGLLGLVVTMVVSKR